MRVAGVGVRLLRGWEGKIFWYFVTGASGGRIVQLTPPATLGAITNHWLILRICSNINSVHKIFS